jgi:hypothetical protein
MMLKEYDIPKDMDGGEMRKIRSIMLFTGNDAWWVNLSEYDEVVDETQEFEDHTEVSIAFMKNGKVVRRLWNPSCDIFYKDDE